MKYILLSATILLFLCACNKEEIFGTTSGFFDDFEMAVEKADLFYEDSLWSSTQMTIEGNFYKIDTLKSSSGFQSLKFYALAGNDEKASKSSLFKNDLALYEGSTIEFSASYYLDDTGDKSYLFIMDLEESAPIGAGPGLRIALDNDQALFVERKKYLEKDIYQSTTKTLFPRQTWTRISLIVKLSQKNKGSIKLYQDGVLIIEKNKTRTLPKDILYSIQGTAGVYTNMEVGITANTQTSPTILYVDDVDLKTID